MRGERKKSYLKPPISLSPKKESMTIELGYLHLQTYILKNPWYGFAVQFADTEKPLMKCWNITISFMHFGFHLGLNHNKF